MLRCRAACALLFIVATGIALFPACGKKGPPFLPEKRMDVRVDHPVGTWTHGGIQLEGTLSGGARGGEIAGCKVSYAWYPEDQGPCEGCPIPMTQHFTDVEMEITGGRFRCAAPAVEGRGVWFIEIRLVDKNGAVGPLSERVRIHSED